MAKRFKLQFSRAFPFFFHSCRNQDDSSTIFPQPCPTPTPNPKHRVSSSSSTVSIGCGCGSILKQKNINKKPNTMKTPPSSMIYNSSMSFDLSDDRLPSSPPSKPKLRFSTSSADKAWFSSSEEDQTFSTDTSFSDSGSHLGAINEKPIEKRSKRRVRRVVKRYASNKGNKLTCPTPECDVDDENSVAVVKKTEDAYGDFRRSMMEMILEKEMFDVGDLENLLQCFLSLNSKQHYGVIVEAFSDIWQILFCKSPRNQ